MFASKSLELCMIPSWVNSSANRQLECAGATTCRIWSAETAVQKRREWIESIFQWRSEQFNLIELKGSRGSRGSLNLKVSCVMSGILQKGRSNDHAFPSASTRPSLPWPHLLFFHWYGWSFQAYAITPIHPVFRNDLTSDIAEAFHLPRETLDPNFILTRASRPKASISRSTLWKLPEHETQTRLI